MGPGLLRRRETARSTPKAAEEGTCQRETLGPLRLMVMPRRQIGIEQPASHRPREWRCLIRSREMREVNPSSKPSTGQLPNCANSQIATLFLRELPPKCLVFPTEVPICPRLADPSAPLPLDQRPSAPVRRDQVLRAEVQLRAPVRGLSPQHHSRNAHGECDEANGPTAGSTHLSRHCLPRMKSRW